MARHARRALSLAAVIALLATLSACSTLRPVLEEPEVRLERVRLLELGVSEQRFGVTLAVTNPNGQGLRIRSLRYALTLADLDLVEGASMEAFDLAANATTEVELEARTQLLGSLPALSRMALGGRRSFDYALRGDVEYGRFLRGRHDFERDGTVTLQVP